MISLSNELNLLNGREASRFLLLPELEKQPFVEPEVSLGKSGESLKIFLSNLHNYLRYQGISPNLPDFRKPGMV